MGQNVNYLLGGSSQLLGADPEVYRQQLVQQEQARIAAMPQQNQLGATIGGLLGRGVANLAQDRNFFEVTNPVLQKLTKIQDIYDTSMKEADPNDPLSFYSALQKNFAANGLGQQAMMAQVEGKKYEDLNLKTEATRTEVYKNNLPLLNADIAKFRAAGNDEKANQLSDMLGRFQVKEDRAAALQNAEILYKNASTDAQRAQAEKLRTDAKEGKVQIVQTPASMGNPATISVFRDGKLESQTPVAAGALPGTGTPTEAPKKGERPPLNSFGGTPGVAPAPAPTATPTTPSAPMAASNTTVSLYDQNTQTYKLTQDPEYLQIVDYARQNATAIAQDPTLRDRIGQAMKDLQAKRQAELGSFVKFQ